MGANSNLIAMVIDDQPMMRSIIRGALKQLGITQVLEAESGNTALEVVRTTPKKPDFIFCDIYMDNGGGTEFINTMRRDDDLKKLGIPVLMLTGEEDEMMLDICRQLGAVTILHKPCSLPQIASALSKIVGFDVMKAAS